MFEQSRLMFIYCVSPVHMGAGQAIGVIDNPIQRERHTNHPNFAGSGLKGAIRHHLEKRLGNEMVKRLFGPDSEASDYAGAVSFGDGQLVCFPVRCLKQAYVYAASPTSLARLKRLAQLTGIKVEWTVPQVGSGAALTASTRMLSDKRLVLEAFDFDGVEDSSVRSIAAWIADHGIPDEDSNRYFRDKIRNDLVMLPDEVFSHFVENATVVEPHVRIKNETGTAESGGLFYTENLPPESLLAAPIFASAERYKNKPSEPMDACAIIGQIRSALCGSLLQIGGDATTGRGQVILKLTESGENDE